MKFKLIEKFNETRSIVQDYMYDAMDELNNASLEEYIQWFKDNLTAYPEDIEQAVTDAYIEACDYGMIKGVEKTRITSELKEYIESHTDIIDDTDELMKQCPDHLQHELKIVLSKLDESLNESVLEEAIRPDLKRFIEQHTELLDENNIEELYKQCPRELKIPLVRMLNAASLGDDIDIIKRATYFADHYDDEELIDLALSFTHHVNDVFDAFDYLMNNWDECFDDDMLNEELLTEDSRSGYAKLWSQFDELVDIGLDQDAQKIYELHHINPTIQRSKDGNTVNYVILPREVHNHMPRKNNPVELYNELKTEFSGCFKTINVSFDVLLLTEEVKQEILNKLETHNTRYKREKDKLRKQELRQKRNDNK